jgi:hypothetical protein
MLGKLRRRRDASEQPSAERGTRNEAAAPDEQGNAGGARAERGYAGEPGRGLPARERGPGPERRRRRLRGRPREAGAAAAGAFGSAVLGIAALVTLAAVLIVLLIVAAIVLRDVDATATNGIVDGVHEGANFFAGAFTGLITFSGQHPKREITVDWGIAAIVYLVVGLVLARLIARIGRVGVQFERRHRPVPSH